MAGSLVSVWRRFLVNDGSAGIGLEPATGCRADGCLPVVPAIVGKKILTIVPTFFCSYVGNRTLGHALCVQRSRMDRPTPIPLTGVDLPNAAPPLGGAFLWLLIKGLKAL